MLGLVSLGAIIAANVNHEHAAALRAAHDLAANTAADSANARAADKERAAEAAGAAPPAEAEVPDEFVCPITSEIMTDPVSTVRCHHTAAPTCRTLTSQPTCAAQVDGFTYERSAIATWLENHDTDPETGVTLESKMLIPNRRLKKLIREFQEAARVAPAAAKQ